jgi:hypothetical protein
MTTKLRYLPKQNFHSAGRRTEVASLNIVQTCMNWIIIPVLSDECFAFTYVKLV